MRVFFVFYLNYKLRPGIYNSVRMLLSMMDILGLMVISFIGHFFLIDFTIYTLVDMDTNSFFDDPINGVWNLYVCLTTANFPVRARRWLNQAEVGRLQDIMMPNYSIAPASAIPFITFMVFNFYFLLNVVLAVIQSDYSALMKVLRCTALQS